MQISRVMIVDDDPSIRRIAEISLTRVGKMQVLIASSGADALVMLSEFSPDVIVMDFMMPGMDGATLFKEIRRTCSTPIIFMTAKVHTHEVDSYYRIGATGVISKPFDPMKLPCQIVDICNGNSTTTHIQGLTIKTATYKRA